jgi:hypothetical protein
MRVCRFVCVVVHVVIVVCVVIRQNAVMASPSQIILGEELVITMIDWQG